MTGSPARKTARLLVHLFTQPQYLLPYLKTNLFARTSALELELPWISYAAIDFLNCFARSEMSVFEFGSGGSTLFFARRCASVISVEDNPIWLEKVHQRLSEARIGNVQLEHRPFDLNSRTGFETSDYLHAIHKQKFDIILIDGSEENVRLRPACFAHAEHFIHAGGIIVLDDSWRYLELRRRNRANRCRIFQSVGPCRPGVTSTDVFFY